MKYTIVENMVVPKGDAKFIKLFIDEEFRREATFFACLISVVPFAFFIIPMTIYWSFTSILVFLFLFSIVPMVCIWIVNRSHQAYFASKRLPNLYHSDNKWVVMSAINSDNPLMEEVFEIYFNNNSSRVEHKCIEVMEAILKKDELNKSPTKGGLKDIEDEIAIESFISTVEAMKELNGD